MGGASRFIMLLTTSPFPTLLRPSVFLRHGRLFTTARHLNLSTPRSTRPLLYPIRSCSSSLHTQPTNNSSSFISSSHPWPEWSHLINSLHFSSEGQAISAAVDHGILPEDAFVAYEEKELSSEFVLSASALLAFARHNPNLIGSLSRRDIEVVVSNGTPFLFKTALETARKMRAFLGVDGTNVLESAKANTVDLVKYILSYASNPALPSARSNIYSRELVESSVRNLLRELAEVNCVTPAQGQPALGQNQFPGGYGQTPRPLNQNIVMKRGDWICPKCSFMNFARNNKCLECEAPRPKRMLTGGEWECPQCDFLNYGRNTACLRCDCNRPVLSSVNPVNSMSASGYNGDYAVKTSINSRLSENEEKAQRWFSKLSEQDSASDVSSAPDEDFPEIMPLGKGENKFVMSTRKTRLDRRLADAPQGNASQLEGESKNLTKSIRQSLDHILGHSSLDSPDRERGRRFVQNVESASSSRFPQSGVSEARSQTDLVAVTNESGMGEKFQLSESQYDSKKKENEEDKSERWFKRMAELHDVKDLPSAVSDEEFPEMMPMRKGENRFVVSKKKDRSLTSPTYKRQMAMDQASSTKYVPFVPFPPGYFARPESRQPDGSDTPVQSRDQVFTGPSSAQSLSPGLDNARRDTENVIHKTENEQASAVIGNSLSWNHGEPSNKTSTRGSNTQVVRNLSDVNNFQPQTSVEGLPNGKFQKEGVSQSPHYTSRSDPSGIPNTSQSTSSAGHPLQPSTNQNARSGWTGKSLEGSAVKEPDPLDMSEEAKAERWFRRVAQIKDISELSQIPDEDFPSIMPMRKGVNRFVVSKRKTPLERRLTSPQYRRNLPVVNSDPVKKDNNSETK